MPVTGAFFTYCTYLRGLLNDFESRSHVSAQTSQSNSIAP